MSGYYRECLSINMRGGPWRTSNFPQAITIVFTELSVNTSLAQNRCRLMATVTNFEKVSNHARRQAARLGSQKRHPQQSQRRAGVCSPVERRDTGRCTAGRDERGFGTSQKKHE